MKYEQLSIDEPDPYEFDEPNEGLEEPEPNLINRPKHYTQHQIECIEIIEMLDLDFHLGNCLKYIWRYREKDGIDALKKAQWYLDRKIAQMEIANGKQTRIR